MRSIGRGDRGDEVRDVQGRLAVLGHRIDRAELERGSFDETTDGAVRAFQQERGLLVDGLVGAQTWQDLVEAGYSLGDRILYLRYPYFRGDDVRALQSRLDTLGFDPGREDGILGDQTGRAVREFQRNVGLNPDGIVGATTVAALERLRSSVAGPARTHVRETEELRSPGSLHGRRIAIDAGHGPTDAGAVGPGGLREADATFAIAEQLAQQLASRNAEPVLLRKAGEDPSVAERVERANASAADALVSIHLNSHDDPSAGGTSAYYFGQLGTVSLAGRALAELLQESIAGELRLEDCRAHPMSFPMLRETRMPAVHLEPCFITNPGEERLLSEGKLPHDLAVTITDALDRYFGGLPDASPA